MHFPWGALTGIRPTKMAYAELAEGRDFAPLFKKFCVSDENIAIIRRVLKAQSAIYNKNKGIGEDIFISLPFCPTKCRYCSFVTAPISSTKQYVDAYISCLEREIASLRPILRDVRSVYIGGGTPFAIETQQLGRVYAAIKTLNLPDCEYTVEAGRPDVFT